MKNIVKKMQDEKKEYRRKMARVAILPEEYRFVYEKIVKYMWSQSCGNGFDMLKTQYELIDLFESAVAEGRHVLEVTGEDVAGFCDELIRDNKLWIEQKRKKLNQELYNKLGKHK